MPVSEKTFRRVALEDPEGHWELHDGELRRKPAMTMEHNNIQSDLHGLLWTQLDRRQFRVHANAGHLRVSAERYYIPDICVIPVALQAPLRGRQVLETYNAPLPLVVEIWSRSTGDFDIETKLRDYQRSGHLEIWRVHPYEHTITAWRRQVDGTYTETIYTSGVVEPVGLPGVIIHLDALFDFED